MNTIISHIAYTPIRKEPDHRSEQVSQLLFGESAEIVDTKAEWLLVKSNFDNYTGWVEEGAIQVADPAFLSVKKIIISEPLIRIAHKDVVMIIPGGAELPQPDPEGFFQFGQKHWCITNYVKEEKISSSNSIVTTAMKFINAPYLWGGRNVFGIDCSGFTQLVYKIHSFPLPRDARDQANIGDPVLSLSEAKPGDLLFFNIKEGLISHTGILLDDERIIHASKWVRTDKVDEKGIFKPENKKYTHQLSSIRRYK